MECYLLRFLTLFSAFLFTLGPLWSQQKDNRFDIQVPGLGAQYNSDDLLQATLANDKARLTKLEEDLDALFLKERAWAYLLNSARNLRAASNELIQFSVSDALLIDNPLAVSASVLEGSVPGNYRLQIQNIATPHSFRSQNPVDPLQEIEPGIYTLELGQESVSLDFSGGSLQNFIDFFMQQQNLARLVLLTDRSLAGHLLLEGQRTGESQSLTLTDKMLDLALATTLFIPHEKQEKSRLNNTELDAKRLFSFSLGQEIVQQWEAAHRKKAQNLQLLATQDSIAFTWENLKPSLQLTASIEAKQIRPTLYRYLKVPSESEYHPFWENFSLVQWNEQHLQQEGFIYKILAPVMSSKALNPEENDELAPKSLDSWVPQEQESEHSGSLNLYLAVPGRERILIDVLNEISLDPQEDPWVPKQHSWELTLNVEDVELQELLHAQWILENSSQNWSYTVEDFTIDWTFFKALPFFEPSLPQDAKILFNNRLHSFDSNSIDLIGLALELFSPSDTGIISISASSLALQEAILGWIYAYNRLVNDMYAVNFFIPPGNEEQSKRAVLNRLDYYDERALLTEVEDYIGLFYGDLTLSNFYSRITSTITQPFPTSEEGLRFLFQLGITLGNRSLNFSDVVPYMLFLEDISSFEETLQTKPLAAKELFARSVVKIPEEVFAQEDAFVDSTGLAISLETAMAPYIRQGGVFMSNLENNKLAIRLKEDQIENYGEKLAKKEEQERRRLGQLQGAIRGTQGALDLLDSLNQTKNNR